MKLKSDYQIYKNCYKNYYIMRLNCREERPYRVLLVYNCLCLGFKNKLFASLVGVIGG